MVLSFFQKKKAKELAKQAALEELRPKPFPDPPAGSAEEPLITGEQLDEVPLGATYAEVEKLLGLGKLVSQTEHRAVYEYKGKNGTATLTFLNGRLNGKVEYDLD